MIRSRWRCYIARAPHAGLLKIGMSMAPRRRVQRLGQEVGERMTLIDDYTVPLGVESRFHQLMRNHPLRVRGEWYRDRPEIEEAFALVKRRGISALQNRSEKA